MSGDLRYMIALSLVRGMGVKTLKMLLAHVGSVEALYNESLSTLSKIEGVTEGLLYALGERAKCLDRADREIDFMTRFDIKALTYLDDAYPERLKMCDDAPNVIYVKGQVDFNRAKMLSIVGTRKSTEEGKMLCERIVGDLARKCGDVVVVSGLAYGMDVCAHRSSLKYGLPTIGVLAHGLDILYPAAHRNTAVQMLQKGSLVTEYVSGVAPESQNFVSRNRIVAGMTQGTLVVESRVRGGSLITARMAKEYGRSVMAVPGFPGMMGSEGCNGLIKRESACLVENADDVIRVLGWNVRQEKRDKESEGKVDLGISSSVEAQKIYKALLVTNDQTASELSRVCSMDVSKVNVELFTMEIEGVVKSLPGGKYHLIS